MNEAPVTANWNWTLADTVADCAVCDCPGPGENPSPPYPSALNVRSPLPAALAVTVPETLVFPHELRL